MVYYIPGAQDFRLMLFPSSGEGDFFTVKIAILGSAKGSTFDFLLTAIELGLVDAEVVAVITDRDCLTEKVAESHGYMPQRIQQDSETSRSEYSRRLSAGIPDDTELVVLGLNRLVGQPLLSRFSNRILNTHPSLLPAYPGFRAIDRLLSEGKSLFGGVSCHIVNQKVDDGPVVIQTAIPLGPEEDSESWGLKVWNSQRRNLCQAVQFFSENRVAVDMGVARVRGGLYGVGLTNPALELDFSVVEDVFQSRSSQCYRDG